MAAVDEIRRGTLGASFSSSHSKDDLACEVKIVVVSEDPYVGSRLVDMAFVHEDGKKFYVQLSRTVPRESGQDIRLRVSMHSGLQSFVGACDAMYASAQGVVYASRRGQRPSEAFIESTHQNLLRVAGVDFIPATVIEIADREDEEVDDWASNVEKIFDGTSATVKDGAEAWEQFQKFAVDVNRFMQGASTRKKKDVSKLVEYKILVLGDVFVGKSCIIDRLAGKRFLDPRYKETDGEQTTQARVECESQELLLSLTEVPGLATSISAEALNNAQAVIVAYSVSSRRSFVAAKAKLDQVLAGKGAARIPALLVSTKNDVSPLLRQVSSKEGKNMASKMSASYAEFSFEEDNLKNVVAGIESMIHDLLDSQQAMGIQIGSVTLTGALNLTDKKFKKFKQKVFTLRDGFIYYSSDGSVTPKTDSISLNAYGVHALVALPSDPANHLFPLELRTPSQHFFLSACTEQEQSNWLDSISSNIVANEIGFSLLDEVMESMLAEVFSSVWDEPVMDKRASRAMKSLNRSSSLLGMARKDSKDKKKKEKEEKKKKK